MRYEGSYVGEAICRDMCEACVIAETAECKVFVLDTWLCKRSSDVRLEVVNRKTMLKLRLVVTQCMHRARQQPS